MKLKLDLSRIPTGWFLTDFRELRMPINHAGDHHLSTGVWYCAIQWIEGGDKLREGRGSTPDEALDNAISSAINWDGQRHINQSRRS